MPGHCPRVLPEVEAVRPLRWRWQGSVLHFNCHIKWFAVFFAHHFYHSFIDSRSGIGRNIYTHPNRSCTLAGQLEPVESFEAVGHEVAVGIRWWTTRSILWSVWIICHNIPYKIGGNIFRCYFVALFIGEIIDLKPYLLNSVGAPDDYLCIKTFTFPSSDLYVAGNFIAGHFSPEIQLIRRTKCSVKTGCDFRPCLLVGRRIICQLFIRMRKHLRKSWRIYYSVLRECPCRQKHHKPGSNKKLFHLTSAVEAAIYLISTHAEAADH